MFWDTWTALDVSKASLVVGALVPVTVLAAGYLLNRRLKSIEHSNWGHQKLIERRLAIYDDMASDLNDLYCVFAFIGDYRAITPVDAIRKKRQLDKTFHTNRFLFSQGFQDLYGAFMATFFDMYTGVATDAKLRTNAADQAEERRDGWKEEWRPMFTSGDWPSPDELDRVYRELMGGFAEELGVPVTHSAP